MSDGVDIKGALFTKRLNEDDYEIPGVATIRLRSVSRHLLLGMSDTEKISPLVAERKMLAAGMVSPAMTEEEAGRWQRAASAGEIAGVLNRIRELSGLAEGADKSRLPVLRDES
jgi:hypothetical protein